MPKPDATRYFPDLADGDVDARRARIGAMSPQARAALVKNLTPAMITSLAKWRESMERKAPIIKTRIAVAVDFFARHFTGPYKKSDSDTLSELICIDYSRPVQVITLSEGERLVGYKKADADPLRGSYFTRNGYGPQTLGIALTGTLRTGVEADKVFLRYRVVRTIPAALESYAAPASDRWSLDGRRVLATGGGKQILHPRRRQPPRAGVHRQARGVGPQGVAGVPQALSWGHRASGRARGAWDCRRSTWDCRRSTWDRAPGARDRRRGTPARAPATWDCVPGSWDCAPGNRDRRRGAWGPSTVRKRPLRGLVPRSHDLGARSHDLGARSHPPRARHEPSVGVRSVLGSVGPDRGRALPSVRSTGADRESVVGVPGSAGAPPRSALPGAGSAIPMHVSTCPRRRGRGPRCRERGPSYPQHATRSSERGSQVPRVRSQRSGACSRVPGARAQVVGARCAVPGAPAQARRPCSEASGKSNQRFRPCSAVSGTSAQIMAACPRVPGAPGESRCALSSGTEPHDWGAGRRPDPLPRARRPRAANTRLRGRPAGGSVL